MGTKGSFDLPVSKEQSTKGARVAYKNMWQREWPHDDDYLRVLAKRERRIFAATRHAEVGQVRCVAQRNARVPRICLKSIDGAAHGRRTTMHFCIIGRMPHGKDCNHQGSK